MAVSDDDRADPPLQREQQADHGDHGDEALAGAQQVVDDLRGARGRLVLGALQGVVVLGVLVVLEVDGDGLLVDEVADVVGDHLAHGLAGDGAERAQERRGEADERRQGDVEGGGAEGGGVVGLRDALRHRVDDELHQVDGEQRQDALDEGEGDGEDGPARGGAPHQPHRVDEVQGVADLGLALLLAQRRPPRARAALPLRRARPAQILQRMRPVGEEGRARRGIMARP